MANKNGGGNNMNKHTQGPWQLHSPTEGDPITGDGSHCITGPDGGVIANVLPQDWHETPANARLIAMAPQLLRILEGFLATLDVEGTEEEVVKSYYNSNIALWNAAIETHMAATGEVAA